LGHIHIGLICHARHGQSTYVLLLTFCIIRHFAIFFVRVTSHEKNNLSSGRLHLFSEEILSVLDSIAGRKHPSTLQIKQLKAFLPLTPILRHCVTSAVSSLQIYDNLRKKTI